ncbi:MAG TPA: triose-phosphate isomerase, partial [candidate division Zixibacteria bacterium]|nr:triose-phosphate isomerase [candidate division Zixibacteria bacterium]
MTRTPFIAGNWKMNGTVDFTRALCRELVAKSSGWPKLGGQPIIDVAVFPSFTALAAAAEVLAGSAISLGAQNM